MVIFDISSWVLLWIMLINKSIENEVVISAIIIIIIIDSTFHVIKFDIRRISLIVLIDGGAEMFVAIKINHQKVMFGIIVIKPLMFIIFRVWYLL